MKVLAVVLALTYLLAAIPALAFEGRACRFKDDMGTAPLYDGVLQYYYDIPCPTYSWYWAIGGRDAPWGRGTAVGAWFEVGDISMGGADLCDPTQCHSLEMIRVLDFEGGMAYYGALRCDLNVYCCDAYGCPVGPSLWTSTIYTDYYWTYLSVDPPLCLTNCAVDPGPPPSRPRILITMTHAGMWYGRPGDNWNAWVVDAISHPVMEGCVMHDTGCLPALYPRPYVSHYGEIHSGYYGRDFEYCPPLRFRDLNDSTPDATEYGFAELAWRIYLGCSGPTRTHPVTWGSIKTLYK